VSYLYIYDWSVLIPSLPLLMKGLVFTIQISFTATALALLLGLPVALLRMAPIKPVSWFAFGYIQLFRSLSLYIYILWIFFGVSIVTGIHINAFQSAVIALTLLNSAYMAEVYRASIQAIDIGQWEAATSLGMSRTKTMVNIIIPQAVRIAIPTLMNNFTDMVKDSSIVAYIGANDLMYNTQQMVTYYSRSFEFYTFTAIIYFVVVFILARMALVLEKRLSRHVATA
jgi:His/Glu/Gln/Arg/opine family amino acid ABC transporter permease subunit